MNHPERILLEELIECLSSELAKHGFMKLQDQTGFVKDNPDFTNLLVLYSDYVRDTWLLTVHVAIQAKNVEMVVSNALERPMLKLDEATVGQSLNVDGKRSWKLTNWKDIIPVCNDLISVFDKAYEYFSENCSVQKIADLLLARPIEPHRAQRILACARLLDDIDLLQKTHIRLNEAFAEIINAPKIGENVKLEYDQFNVLYARLRSEMVT